MSEKIKDGGPAFPRTYNGDGHNGMTLRDYLAAKAMQGILAHPRCDDVTPKLAINAAREAFEIADAMLKAREVKP